MNATQAKYRAAQACSICHAPSGDRHWQCRACRIEAERDRKIIRDARRARGECTQCGRQVTTFTLCDPHYSDARHAAAKHMKKRSEGA